MNENNNIQQSDVLKYAVENGIINMDDVLCNIKDMERKQILEQHQFEIWRASDGRWKTHIADDTKPSGRVLKAKSTRKDIEDVIVDEYKKRIKTKTDFETLYYEWLNYALEYGDLTKGTVDRYNNDYDKFYAGTDFVRKDVCQISSVDISRFLKSIACGRKDSERLTKRCFSNIKALIIGTFTYATSEKELNCIPIRTVLKDIKVSKKHFKQMIVKDSEQVFSDDEVVLMADYIIHNYRSTRELGILFALLTGVRVGELCTLKSSDHEGYRLYIQRTEIKEKDANGKSIVKVREYPKTEASMSAIELTDSALIVLNMIIKYNLANGIKSDYLFYDNQYGRIKRTSFDKKIRRICNELGIPVRSMHKLRKTYASALLECDVESKIVQGQMRHKDIATTQKHYEFSMRNREYKRDKLNKADFLKLGIGNEEKVVQFAQAR